MNKSHFQDFETSSIENAARMQTVSSKKSFDAQRRHQNKWDDWTTGASFQQTVESVDQPADSLELPFSPEDRGQEEIQTALKNISSYRNAERERIYRHAKDLYTSELDKLKAKDVIDVCQTLNFAERNGHSDWMPDLKDTIETFFDGIEENPVFLRQDNEKDIKSLDIHEIREALEERERCIKDASEAAYGSSDDEVIKKLITDSQKSYLWILLQNSDEFNNLPLS